MSIKFTNNFLSTLATGVGTLDTVLALDAGDGALLPAYTDGDYEYLTLFNSAGNLEIVKVTGRTTDSLTVVRAQDGTVARTWIAGDFINSRPCAAAMYDALQVNVAKADVHSPVFTGEPSLPLGAVGITPDEGDNSDKLATTAYVERAAETLLEAVVTGITAATTTTYSTAGAHTWTKPTSGTMALIEVWGAGGSGGRNSNASGGGGGGYSSRLIPLSALGTTETVTVGAGGASRTSNASGIAGGGSSFGAHCQAGGGGGGSAAAFNITTGPGGGGGGITRGGFGGSVSYVITDAEIGLSTTTPAPGEPVYESGSGGGAASQYGASNGIAGTATAGGTSIGQGGNGGAGARNANAVAGTAPGGGGGGAYNGNSGAGANGRVKVTVW